MEGLAELIVAVHGPTAACHELHTGIPGSFEAAARALGRARAGGQRAIVGTWVTRSSCRSLAPLVDWMLGHRVAGWVLGWPRVTPSRADEAARTVPRLGIAIPHALRAVQRAQTRGMPVVLVGIPSCVLGPFAERCGPAGEGGFAEPCERCAARGGCSGIDPWYLDRFGAEELRPVEAIERRAAPPWLESSVEAVVTAMEGER